MSDWPHAPSHRFNEKGTYIVTGATYEKQHFFKHANAMDFLQQTLINLAINYKWNLLAWAIFSNHYHFIATTIHDPQNLKNLITEYHARSSHFINQIDNQLGRRIWYQFWDTHLTHHYSYLARMNYVMQNPVKHGLVPNATDYPWCSTAFFEKNNSPTFIKVIKSFKIDRVNVKDDF